MVMASTQGLREMDPQAEPMAQLIDYEGNFVPGVEEWMERHDLKDLGFDYSVVTVLGCQSSGKSTLLNQLFGTEFPVMNAQAGRSQTTKGLWIGRDSKYATIIVDVEGTDSRERGEDRLTFEHRTALFSLALADTLIVNMWYTDLGRRGASNIDLLKTVLAVNLQLFQQQQDCPKTRLLFVIRDHSDAMTPLEKLRRMIDEDLCQIWKDINKPDHLLQSQVEDFFDIETVGLPSKFADAGGFDAAVSKLREQFNGEYRPKQYSRAVPADGFSFYCQSIWDTILKSSDLDIPSQKQMLATYRCEEVKNAAIEQALPIIRAKMAEAERGALQAEETAWAQEVIEKALSLYDEQGSRYLFSVYMKKREQLIDQLQAELQKIVDVHLGHLRQKLVAASADELANLYRSSEDGLEDAEDQIRQWTDFKATTEKWKAKYTQAFRVVAEAFSFTIESSVKRPLSAHGDATATPGQEQVTVVEINFEASQALQAFTEQLSDQQDRVNEKQLSAFRSFMSSQCSKALGNVEALMEDPEITSEKFWNSLTKICIAAKEHCKDELGVAWMGLQLRNEEASEQVWDAFAGKETLTQLRRRLENVCDWLENHVNSRFHLFFDQDTDGVPRQWQDSSAEKIREIYLAAKAKALELLQILENLDLDQTRVLPEGHKMPRSWSEPLLNDVQKQKVLTKSNRHMQKCCQEAQLIQATGGMGTSVPWWMWGLLLAFGYNEISAVLFSPFALLAIMIVALIGGLIFATGNFGLPVTLLRQGAGMLATTLISILSSVQQSGEGAAVVSRPNTALKKEVKQESQ